MNYQDLADLIDGHGAAVVMPGEKYAALPALRIVPLSLNMIEGYDVLHHECDIEVLTNMGRNDPPHFDDALVFARQVIGSLLVSPIMLTESFPIDTVTESSEPAIRIAVNLVFPASDPIEPVEPEPEPVP